MYIELTKKHAGELGIELEDVKTGATGEAWLMLPFTVQYPKKVDFLAFYHPYSGVFFVDAPERGWKKDVVGAVINAFEKYLDHIESFDYSVQAYMSALTDLQFVPVTHAFKNVANEFYALVADLKDDYKELPAWVRPYYNSTYGYLSMSDEINFKPSDEEEETLPVEDLETYGILRYLTSPRQVYAFEDNKTALMPPRVRVRPRKSKKDKNKPGTQSICMVPKEPADENMMAVGALAKEFRQLIREPKNEEVKKRLDEINEEIAVFMTVPFSEFTGEYEEFRDRAFDEMIYDFLITLDLPNDQKAQRRVLVDADMSFVDFETLLNRLFRWKGFPYHQSAFLFSDEDGSYEIDEVLEHPEAEYPENEKKRGEDLHPEPIDFFHSADKKDIRDYKLKDYFPKHKSAHYRYDYGDNWTHAIELMDVHDKKKMLQPLPYLLDSCGVAPPEDVGGLGPFEDILNLESENVNLSQYSRTVKSWMDENRFFLRSPCDLSPLFKESD